MYNLKLNDLNLDQSVEITQEDENVEIGYHPVD